MAAVLPEQRIGFNGFPIVVQSKFVLYNSTFMTQMEVATGSEWAAISIIAHEVGHHVANHVTPRNLWEANKHPWQKELEADRYSGMALARMGASPADLHKAQRLMFTLWGNATHPNTVERIRSINHGWREGGGTGNVEIDLLKVWQSINQDLTEWR